MVFEYSIAVNLIFLIIYVYTMFENFDLSVFYLRLKNNKFHGVMGETIGVCHLNFPLRKLLFYY